MPDWRGFRRYYGNRHTKPGPLGFELGAGIRCQTQEFAHVWKKGGSSQVCVNKGSLSHWRSVSFITLEDRVAGDDAFQLAEIGSIHNRHQRVIVHVAQCRIERKIRIQTRKRLWLEHRAQSVLAFAFVEKPLELVAADGVPAAGMHAHQKSGICGILYAARVGVYVILRAEDCGRNGKHGVFDAKDSFFAIFLERRKDEAVLARKHVEDGNIQQAARDEIRKRVGNDDRDDDLVVAADFENHEYGGHGDTEKSREEDAHADEDIRAGGSGELRKVEAFDVAYRAAKHGSDEERGGEHSARSTADE